MDAIWLFMFHSNRNINTERVAERKMQSLNNYMKTMSDESTKVVYNLFFKNALYSLESYKENYEVIHHYSMIENLTDDEGEAETFLKLIAIGKVSPVHTKDIAEDYFRKKY